MGKSAIRAETSVDIEGDAPELFVVETEDNDSNDLSLEPVTTAITVSSGQLMIGRVYTRAELKDLFMIKDATIYNGVFRFGDSREIWLFITEQKQADRVQYRDELVGDELHWQGQSLGRTDNLIINHRQDGNAILVFYRTTKVQYPGAGFKLEGQFDYVSHSGREPASFVLKRRNG